MPSRKPGESQAEYKARNARLYRRRLEKAAAEGKSRQEGRGRHPSESIAKRPGRGARVRKTPEGKPIVFGTDYEVRRRSRTFESAGSASGEIVIPWDRQRDIRTFVSTDINKERIDEGRLVFRFGGFSLANGSPPGPSHYISSEYEFYHSWELFMNAATIAAKRFVERRIVDVHFAWYDAPETV